MSFGADWATVFVVGVFAVTSPGPDMLVTLRSSLVGSTRAGLFTALGIGIGLCFHTGYSLVGLAVLISQSIVLFSALKLIGAAYLIFIGWKAIRARGDVMQVVGEDERQPISAGAALRAGLFTNLTNPKVTLFFLALFTQVIEPETSSSLKALYGGTIIAISLTWFGFLAMVVGHEAVRARLRATSHWIERIAGGLFIALGVRLVFAKAASN
ncbi:MAG: LysE family transporter [Dehalococcoidia bacterium]|nr:LysE family transporter [Dehalococcoidia bacterium]